MHRRPPARLKGFDYRGPYRYHAGFRTARSAAYFEDAGAVSLVRSQILRAAAEFHFAVLAYCFMPDHVHLVVLGQEATSDFATFLARAKQYSGYEFGRATRKPLWQRYAFERLVRVEEVTEVVIRYVLENPVRAGLVGSPREYPFLGSCVYTLDELMEALQLPRRTRGDGASG